MTRTNVKCFLMDSLDVALCWFKNLTSSSTKILSLWTGDCGFETATECKNNVIEYFPGRERCIDSIFASVDILCCSTSKYQKMMNLQPHRCMVISVVAALVMMLGPKWYRMLLHFVD